MRDGIKAFALIVAAVGGLVLVQLIEDHFERRADMARVGHCELPANGGEIVGIVRTAQGYECWLIEPAPNVADQLRVVRVARAGK